MTALDTKLLPCPFCGGNVKCVADEYGSGGQHVPPHHVICKACDVVITREFEDDAIAAWNRRVSPSQGEGPAAPPPDTRCDYCKEHGFQHPHLCEDCRAAQGVPADEQSGETSHVADDGQPDEAQEWHDYDPDC